MMLLLCCVRFGFVWNSDCASQVAKPTPARNEGARTAGELPPIFPRHPGGTEGNRLNAVCSCIPAHTPFLMALSPVFRSALGG